MNQILISEKVYVTPEMKKKKKLFKIEFLLSVFLLCILSSYAIYAEYDRNKSEEVSREILESIEFKLNQEKYVPNVQSALVKIEDQYIKIVLNKILETNEEIDITPIVQEVQVPEEQKLVASDGTKYYTIGVINIPSINVNYPILSTTTVELLKISPCKFHGANPNEVGNLCIVGHNYRNSKFFSKVPNLNIGDTIELTDLSKTTLTYKVYDKYIVDPKDTSCTSQKTDGRKEITLITCTNDNKQRVVIKAMEI